MSIINRIIYNSQGFFVAPYSGEQINGSDFYVQNHRILKRIEKIQGIDYSISEDQINLTNFGVRGDTVSTVSGPTDVNLSFSYIPDGFTNENRLNLNVGHFNNNKMDLMFSGILKNNDLVDRKDFFLVINKKNTDIIGNYPINKQSIGSTAQLTGIIDPASRDYGLLHFQNFYINTYNMNVAVGNIPTVNQSYVGDNIIFYSSGSGITYTTLNNKSGHQENSNERIIIPRAFDQYDSNLSGENIFLPGEIALTISSDNPTGVRFFAEDVEAFSYKIDFNRFKLTSLNYKFPISRPISFPVAVDISASLNAKSILTGSFFDTLDKTQNYNLILDINSNRQGVSPSKILFSGCNFNSISYDSSIRTKNSAELNFRLNINPDDVNKAIFSSGNILYCSLEGSKKMLIF